MTITVGEKVLHGAVRDPRTGALVWAPGGLARSRALAEQCHETRVAAAARPYNPYLGLALPGRRTRRQEAA
jgi:hypothetical protein